MGKLEDLTEVAAELSDQQLDGLIDFARALTHEAYFHGAPDEVRDAVARGLAQHRSGSSEPASKTFDELRRRLQGSSK
jgi:hypothetical protein